MELVESRSREREREEGGRQIDEVFKMVRDGQNDNSLEMFVQENRHTFMGLMLHIMNDDE